MHWESENVSIFTKLILLLYPNKSLIKWLCYSTLFNSQNNNFAFRYVLHSVLKCASTFFKEQCLKISTYICTNYSQVRLQLFLMAMLELE